MVRSGSVLSGPLRFGPFRSVPADPVRLGSIRYGSVPSNPIRFIKILGNIILNIVHRTAAYSTVCICSISKTFKLNLQVACVCNRINIYSFTGEKVGKQI